ncbi:hypothetical protein E2C01_058018 [Portunus trituberculatus]|uniref:Uncharacterized protein n=1 Tax=Portunus trituberculatus TaxID=210409 RepID=A0A5B7GV28_PORTR|nr:hypothetical protein [Portunus trituberculatus]
MEQRREESAGESHVEPRGGSYWRQRGHVEKAIGLITPDVGRGCGGSALYTKLSPGLAEGDVQTGINSSTKSSSSCNSSERVGGSAEDPATPFVEEDGSDALVGEEEWWGSGEGRSERLDCVMAG